MSLWCSFARYFDADPLGAACFALLCASLTGCIAGGVLSVLMQRSGRRTR